MLPSWVSSCDIDGRTIFLDIRRNRYTAMASNIAVALKAGDDATVPPKILNQITDWGWRGEGAGGRQPAQAMIEKPNIELSALGRGERASLALIGSALASVAITRYRLSTERFENLLRRVSVINDDAEKLQTCATMNQIISAAEVVERTVLGSKACLLRSLALHRLLALCGHPSALIFGVRLNPFKAHCWLQQGNVVLNDTIEQTGLFTALRLVE